MQDRNILLYFYSKDNGLFLGKGANSWSVYKSAGPYLTDVSLSVDLGVAVVNKTVAIELVVTRETSGNVSKGKH